MGNFIGGTQSELHIRDGGNTNNLLRRDSDCGGGSALYDALQDVSSFPRQGETVCGIWGTVIRPNICLACIRIRRDWGAVFTLYFRSRQSCARHPSCLFCGLPLDVHIAGVLCGGRRVCEDGEATQVEVTVLM